jgi:nitrite reductase/ring-hydroxylating ferredoxin subunit
MALFPLLLATASARFFVPAVQPAAPTQQMPVQDGFLQPYVELVPAATSVPVASDSRSVSSPLFMMGAGAGIAVLGVMGFGKAKSVLASRSGAIEMSGGAKSIPTKKVWVTFANAADCPPGEIASGFQFGQEIAIANDKGKLYAIANKLPPTSQPATFGELEGNGILREPITGTAFDMKTGKPTGEWCPSLVGKLFRLLVGPQGVNVYPVRKSGSKIEVNINVNAKAQFEANYWRGVLDAQGKVDGGYY